MSIIQALYQGQIKPQEMQMSEEWQTEYTCLLRMIERLRRQSPESCEKDWKNFDITLAIVLSIEREESFGIGFSIGTRLFGEATYAIVAI